MGRSNIDPEMNTDPSLTQKHVFHLSRTLMVPVTLFRSGGELGVLPSGELDDEDDLEIVQEYVPGGSHQDPSSPLCCLRAAGGKGSCVTAGMSSRARAKL